MIKNIITTTSLLVAISTSAQVAIGKTEISNPDVSLEFANTENKGVILPYVETKTGITENGSIIYDITDHKVKYLKDGSWFDLSVDTTGQADLSIQSTKTEQATAKTVIGADGATNNTSGILVLSDTNKAMILPKVASPHLNIIDPAPGMIAYDTNKRQLAVYNGSVWTFWKP
ncbi:hypothetical protein [Epilithonimonas caeni]|uniref:hypothetical protein n=1 Tax=Epilithonimonas caeni TaxID=365343 RepID=UPI00042181B4|nr:hypothetical protein [Epilithonimonas caeni]